MDDLSVFHHTVDLRDDGGVIRLAGFKKLSDARQASCDVTGLADLPGHLGQHISWLDLIVLIDDEISACGKVVEAAPFLFFVFRVLFSFDDDPGMKFLCLVFDDDSLDSRG